MNAPVVHDEADLLRNCLAFFARAVKDMTDAGQDRQMLAYASIDLAVAIEVLLKARLVREHWTLICVEPGKTNIAGFRNGDLKTISPEDALDRLANVVGLNVKPHVEQVKAISRLRNRAAHFRPSSRSADGVRAELGQGLDFASWFLRQEFVKSEDQTVADLADETLDVIAEQLASITEYNQSCLSRIKKDLDRAPLAVQCPRCFSPSLVVLGDCQPKCLVCETVWEAQEAANDYVNVVLHTDSYTVIKDGGEWPVYHCLECDVEALVSGVHDMSPNGAIEHLDSADNPLWGCFNCAFHARGDELDRCSRCGEPTRGDTCCPECWDYVLGRD